MSYSRRKAPARANNVPGVAGSSPVQMAPDSQAAMVGIIPETGPRDAATNALVADLRVTLEPIGTDTGDYVAVTAGGRNAGRVVVAAAAIMIAVFVSFLFSHDPNIMPIAFRYMISRPRRSLAPVVRLVSGDAPESSSQSRCLRDAPRERFARRTAPNPSDPTSSSSEPQSGVQSSPPEPTGSEVVDGLGRQGLRDEVSLGQVTAEPAQEFQHVGVLNSFGHDP